MNRDQYEHHVSMSLAAVLSKEEHKNIMDCLHSLSDEDFIQAVEEMKENCPEDITARQMMKEQYEIRRKRDSMDTGYDNIPVAFLTEEENAEWLNSISKSRPTNLILLDDTSAVTDIWRTNNQTATGVPSDLFFSGNIPVPDCRIHFKDAKGGTVKFRTVIFPDYRERIRSANEDASVQVGAVIYRTVKDSFLIFSIEVLRGHDWLMSVMEIGYKSLPKNVRENLSRQLSIAEISAFSSELLGIWYGVQIALLHPVVKDVFLNPVTVVDESENKKSAKKGKKKPLRYIKRHILNAEELKKRIHGGNNFQRHALVWYVIGHWRKYADGRKIFIQPYWKGALRELKNGEIREREIVQEETI